MQVTWEPKEHQLSMQHIWNTTSHAELPMVDPSGEFVDLWVHNYGDMVLITVDELHVDHLPDFWHEYGLDDLGQAADCDWGPLLLLDDRR